MSAALICKENELLRTQGKKLEKENEQLIFEVQNLRRQLRVVNKKLDKAREFSDSLVAYSRDFQVRKIDSLEREIDWLRDQKVSEYDVLLYTIPLAFALTIVIFIYASITKI